MSQERKEREEKEDIEDYESDVLSHYSGDEISDDDEEEKSIDVKKGRQLFCKNKTISQYPISISDIENRMHRSVTLFVYKLGDVQHIECMIYSDLLKFLIESAPVFFYPEGSADENKPVYMLPTSGIYIQANYFLLSRYSCFHLHSPEDKKVGSNFGISRKHGAVEKVYKIEPIAKSRLPEIIPLDDNDEWLEKNDYSPMNYPKFNSDVLSNENREFTEIIFLVNKARSHKLIMNYRGYNNVLYRLNNKNLMEFNVRYKKDNRDEYIGREIEYKLYEQEINDGNVDINIVGSKNQNKTVDIVLHLHIDEILRLKEKIHIPNPYIEGDLELSDYEEAIRSLTLEDNLEEMMDIIGRENLQFNMLMELLKTIIKYDRINSLEYVLEIIKQYYLVLYENFDEIVKYCINIGKIKSLKVLYINVPAMEDNLGKILENTRELLANGEYIGSTEDVRECLSWLQSQYLESEEDENEYERNQGRNEREENEEDSRRSDLNSFYYFIEIDDVDGLRRVFDNREISTNDFFESGFLDKAIRDDKLESLRYMLEKMLQAIEDDVVLFNTVKGSIEYAIKLGKIDALKIFCELLDEVENHLNELIRYTLEQIENPFYPQNIEKIRECLQWLRIQNLE